MRVGVVMFYDDAIKDYGDINYNINKLYCEKYHLDLIVSHTKLYKDRHSAWERLPLILKHIKNYDYIVWIDADAFFYLHSPNIINFLNNVNNKDFNFIFSKDIEYDNINTGIFIVKNTQYSIDFITKWAYDEDLYKNNPYPGWWDQGVLIDMYNKNILDIQNNQITYDYGILQHFREEELVRFATLARQPYVFHCAGKNRYDRFNISTHYYNNINKNYIMNFEIEKQDYESKNSEKQIYLDDLKNIILNGNTPLEGNCFYHHETLHLYSDLYTKQLNLFWCGKQAISRICEIGFNAGHSSLLMLLGRDKTQLEFTIFDIGQHPYTKPSIEYMKSKFTHVNFEYIEGDSTITMPKWIYENKKNIETYDIVHVDGGHSEHCISHDMKNTMMLVKKNGLVIIDDTNAPEINKYVDFYISTGIFVEINVLNSYGYQHRIIKKIK
jgi:hypothetical protein